MLVQPAGPVSAVEVSGEETYVDDEVRHLCDDQGPPESDLLRPRTDRVVHAEDVIDSWTSRKR